MTCTVCYVLHGWSRGQQNEQLNNAPRPKNNSAAGYKGPVKLELLKCAGLLLLGNVNLRFCDMVETSVLSCEPS